MYQLDMLAGRASPNRENAFMTRRDAIKLATAAGAAVMAATPAPAQLTKTKGNRTRAAKLLGISRRTLHRKLVQWPELDVTDR